MIDYFTVYNHSRLYSTDPHLVRLGLFCINFSYICKQCKPKINLLYWLKIVNIES